MKLRALLLGVILSLGCSTVVAHDYDDYAMTRTKYKLWLDLCLDFRAEVTCGKTKAPKVVRKHLRKGLNGYYDGGDTVYVSNKLYGWERDETILHEMSHYLDSQIGLNPEMPVKRSDTPNVLKLCQSEKRAFAVSDKHIRRYQRRTSRPIGARWVTWYDHCRQFADVLYPDVYDAPLPERAWVLRRARGLFQN